MPYKWIEDPESKLSYYVEYRVVEEASTNDSMTVEISKIELPIGLDVIPLDPDSEKQKEIVRRLTATLYKTLIWARRTG